MHGSLVHTYSRESSSSLSPEAASQHETDGSLGGWSVRKNVQLCVVCVEECAASASTAIRIRESCTDFRCTARERPRDVDVSWRGRSASAAALGGGSGQSSWRGRSANAAASGGASRRKPGAVSDMEIATRWPLMPLPGTDKIVYEHAEPTDATRSSERARAKIIIICDLCAASSSAG